MKKLFTLAAAVLASISLTWAETVDDLKVISANYNVYFEDVVTSNVTAGTLITDYVLSQIANTYKTNQGTDKTVGKLYCLRVKSTSQDVLAFKVSSSCTLVLYANRATDRTPYLDTKVAAQGESSITGTPTSTDGAKGYVTYSIPAAGTYYIIGNGSDCYLAGLEFSDFCTDPELTVSPTEGTGFVGDAIDIAVTSKNHSKPINPAVTVDGVAGVYGTDYTFKASTGLVQATPLKAGTFVVTFSQASNDTYCAAEESATFVISEKNPVTAVTIDGPTAGYVGYELTYTATADNATAYQWLVDGVDANTNAATFKYTAVKGNHSIVCKARNEFNAEDEWIASDPIELTVTNVSGTLVSFTVNSDANGAANLSGVLAADANPKVSLTKGSSQALDEYTGYKMDKGKYVGVTLNQGSFAEGDTVSFMVTKASGTAKLYLYNDENGTNRLDSIAFSGQTGWATFVLNQATTGVYLYRSNPDVKPYDQNPYVAALKVIRPMAAKSTVESLTAVSVDDEAISAANLATLLADHEVTVADSYVDAPVVKFTKHVVTTYEDDSQKESDKVITVTAEEVAGVWQAATTINSIEYVVKAAKLSSVVVTYMDGATKLGEENVEVGGHPANYAQYQNKSLYSFLGWFNNPDLAEEHKVADISAEVINVATTFYAKFENAYATSVNFEKIVMQNGKGYAIIPQLGTQHYASNITGSLDSLDNSKSDSLRNYAYLGLKVKQSGALLNFRLAKDNTVKIKFGNVAKTPKASINGGDYADITITDKVYTYTAEEDALISIKMMDGNAVVFQQIMIGEDLQAPELYDIKYTTTNDHGTISGVKKGIPGETIKVYENRQGGWKLHTITVNGEVIDESETMSIFEFIMPNAVANVSGTFEVATSLDNTEDNTKAVKMIENGQIVIIKNGVRYNVLGAVLK